MKLRNLIIAFVLGASLAAGIWLSTMQRRPPELATATILPATAAIPAFSLLDHKGNAIDENVFKGQWDLVFFGFTNCPDICPLTLQVLSSAKRKLAEDGHSPLPRIVLVSVDPERDTPDILDAYVSLFGDDNLGITGDIAELRKLTQGLGIYFEKRDADSDNENYSVDHAAAVIVIDAEGRFHSLFGGPHIIENFSHDLPLIMAN
jgi:protein SCO1/2